MEEMKDMEKITDESLLDHVVGGTDYSYAHDVMSKMLTMYQNLINQGVSPDSARAQVKQKYWNSLISVCKKYPEKGLTPEQQAEIIFMLTLG